MGGEWAGRAASAPQRVPAGSGPFSPWEGGLAPGAPGFDHRCHPSGDRQTSAFPALNLSLLVFRRKSTCSPNDPTPEQGALSRKMPPAPVPGSPCGYLCFPSAWQLQTPHAQARAAQRADTVWCSPVSNQCFIVSEVHSHPRNTSGRAGRANIVISMSQIRKLRAEEGGAGSGQQGEPALPAQLSRGASCQ